MAEHRDLLAGGRGGVVLPDRVAGLRPASTEVFSAWKSARQNQ